MSGGEILLMASLMFKDKALIDARKNRIIVLEELNFIWDEEELIDLASQWYEGISVAEMAKYFKRDPDEIVLAVMHLSREGKIGQRKGGLAGGKRK
jgi:hypothetical protein